MSNKSGPGGVLLCCYVLKSESLLWAGEKERWLEVAEDRRRLEDSGASRISSASNPRSLRKETGSCANFQGIAMINILY